ncbi:12920_t:CDS:2, partial [Gigaspora rosea]
LEDIPQKKRNDVKKSLLSFNIHFFPDEKKILAADQPQRNFIDILDAYKMADFMLLILSAKVEVDQFGELCLKAIQSQGFP